MGKKITRIKQSDDAPHVCNNCLADSWKQCHDFTITMRQLDIGNCSEEDINYIYVIEDSNDWISHNSDEFHKFVILDDNSDMDNLHDSFVQTDTYDSFGYKDYRKAVKILESIAILKD